MITIIDVSNIKGIVDKTILPAGYELKITRDKGVLLVRDFFSSIPLFYVVENCQLIFAGSYLELLGALNSRTIESKPDLEYMKLYMAFQAPFTSRTLDSKIKILRPGEQLMLDTNGECKKEFVTQGVKTDSQVTQNELRNAIESSIETLNPDETTFHISSGLDSSILAITAARVFPENTIRLASCITRGSGCSDEIVNSKKIADEIGADIDIYDFTDIDVFKEGKELIRNCLGYPIAHPSHLVEYLLNKKIAASGTKTIINGKGPDDCLAGYAWHLEDFEQPLQHKHRLMMTAESELVALTGSSLIFQAEENYWKNIEHPLSLKQRLEYDVRSLTEAWNIIHCALAGNLGVRIISPFMEPGIRSDLFALDDKLKINNGQQKYFLRQSFIEDYPEYILNFSKHGLRLDLRPYFLDYSRADLFSRITCDVPWIDQYFNVKKIWQMIDATVCGEKNYGWQLWSIFCLINALQS